MKLDKRFKSAETVARVCSKMPALLLEETRMRKRWEEEMEVFREVEDSDVFGFECF